MGFPEKGVGGSIAILLVFVEGGFVEMIKSDQTGWQKTSGCMFYQLVGEICSVNKIMREWW